MSAGSPDLYLLAGPNGAGKTTFYEKVLSTTRLDFINADMIAAHRWPGDEAPNSYAAAAEAAQLRARYIEQRRSFITETVFSHPSKVDLVQEATAAGYRVHLRVLVVPVGLSVARVAQRVAEGGHDVPNDKIRERHVRLWAHVAEAIELAYEARVYDSSRQSGDHFVEVARYQYGQLLGEPAWPRWTPEELMRVGRGPG